MSRAYCETAGHTWREETAECMMCGAIVQCYACDATATGSRTVVEGRPPNARGQTVRACKRHSDGGDPKRRREVAHQRAIAARQHILTAMLHCQAACRDIVEVRGLAEIWRALSGCAVTLKRMREDLEDLSMSNDSKIELVHEPTDDEHGSVHGCGGVHSTEPSGETVPG